MQPERKVFPSPVSPVNSREDALGGASSAPFSAPGGRAPAGTRTSARRHSRCRRTGRRPVYPPAGIRHSPPGSTLDGAAVPDSWPGWLQWPGPGPPLFGSWSPRPGPSSPAAVGRSGQARGIFHKLPPAGPLSLPRGPLLPGPDAPGPAGRPQGNMPYAVTSLAGSLPALFLDQTRDGRLGHGTDRRGRLARPPLRRPLRRLDPGDGMQVFLIPIE